MLSIIIAIVGILLTILFVIGTHEAAHFYVARLLGVKVLRFSIGFGKVLWRHVDKHQTEYVLSLIPLGGYVKMLDENEAPVPQAFLSRAFNRQPFYKKFLIVLAGPACNLLCALLLYWFIFMIGITTVRPIIGTVTPGSIAAHAGLRAQTEIIEVDHDDVSGWLAVLLRLVTHLGDDSQLQIITRDINNQQLKTHQLNLKNWQLDGLNPDPLLSIGIKPYQPNIPLIIGMINPNAPAQHSGLRVGDKLIAINQQTMNSWEQISQFIATHPQQTLQFKILRKGKQLIIPVMTGTQKHLFHSQTGYLGIGPKVVWPPELLHKIQYGPVDAIGAAYKEVHDFVYFNFVLFGKMISGKLSLQSLGGPITIFESAGDALNYGFLPFLGFLAFLSIAIGVINLLPIPGLDGGHLFIQIIEAIIQKPIPEKILLLLYRLGFLLIFFFLFQAIMNDVLRLV